MNSQSLLSAADTFGTPLYVYDADAVISRIATVLDLFGGRFGVSYAIKANPNLRLLEAMRPHLTAFDASSFAEVERALAAGMPAEHVSFSGPAKRPEELRGAVDLGVGELVVEGLDEAVCAGAYAQAAGVEQPVLIRINPTRVPRKFGASMAGTASQFGIDEEDMAELIPAIRDVPGLKLIGFHIYSGTNCLDAPAIAENFAIFADVFRQAQAIAGIAPERLIFGSAFGIPYLPGEAELDHLALPALVNPIVDELLSEPAFASARCNLEMGRWLVGPAGWLLTRVIARKTSRGAEIRACDAGFNNHLAACGMLGSVFRRNWVYLNLSNPDGPVSKYNLVGPLCTTIDRLALDIELPATEVGHVLAIPQSGAYGLTSSPTRFISHPEPGEVLISDGKADDVTESWLNHNSGRRAAHGRH